MIDATALPNGHVGRGGSALVWLLKTIQPDTQRITDAGRETLDETLPVGFARPDLNLGDRLNLPVGGIDQPGFEYPRTFATLQHALHIQRCLPLLCLRLFALPHNQADTVDPGKTLDQLPCEVACKRNIFRARTGVCNRLQRNHQP